MSPHEELVAKLAEAGKLYIKKGSTRLADYQEAYDELSRLKNFYEKTFEESGKKKISGTLRFKQLAIVSDLLLANIKKSDNLTYFLLEDIVKGVSNRKFEKDNRTTITENFVKERIKSILDSFRVNGSIHGNSSEYKGAVTYVPFRREEYGLIYLTLCG